MTRALVLSSVFPSAARPTYGVFVWERVRRVAAHAEVVVVAPVPWFPFNAVFRGVRGRPVPFVEVQDGLAVYHPRYLGLPRYGRALDAIAYAARMLPLLKRLRRRFSFDLIDAHFSYPDGVAGVLLGRIFRCPTVITLRGSHDIRQASGAWRRPQIRRALQSASAVIAVSRSLERFAVQLGVPAERIRVIPNGVDGEQFHPGDRAAARDALGLPRDRAVLLSVGGLNEGKGHHRVVEMLPRIRAARPDVMLVVIGGDEFRDGTSELLSTMIARHGLADHVRVMSPRPHAEIATWMIAADLFCLATRSEGWCNAITEALACGLPVVTTAVGGNPEIVRDEEHGYLVPFWDAPAFERAVLRALDRRWDRSHLAAVAGGHSWDATAEQVMTVFDDVRTASFASGRRAERGTG